MQKFKFGPLQRRWLQALESGGYKQGTPGKLREDRGGKGRARYAYCCLGVADRVCKLGETDDLLLVKTFNRIGLHNASGAPHHGIAKSLLKELYSLTMLNDGGGSSAQFPRHTFKQIAAILRANPTAYFSKSV